MTSLETERDALSRSSQSMSVTVSSQQHEVTQKQRQIKDLSDQLHSSKQDTRTTTQHLARVDVERDELMIEVTDAMERIKALEMDVMTLTTGN